MSDRQTTNIGHWRERKVLVANYEYQSALASAMRTGSGSCNDDARGPKGSKGSKGAAHERVYSDPEFFARRDI